MIRLFIAEKPSLAQAVAAVLPGNPEKHGVYTKVGDNYFVPLAGHILEQEMPDHYLPDDVPRGKSGNKVWRAQDLPIVPKQWVMKPRDDTKRNLAAIKELLPKCDEVIHLGDPDAEGQLLVDEVLLFLGNRKPVRRLLVNDYNATKVKQALAAIKSNDDPQFRGWYKWALARSHYDWLFGLNITRAATLRARELGYDGVLTVGSVQTPTLKIVVDRDRVIEGFKPIPYFTLTATLQHANGAFRANWKAKEGQAGLDEAGRLVDAAIAKGIAAKVTGKPATITHYEKADKKEAPPLPLSLNELTMFACSKYGYTAEQVLDAAQALYETYKVTTYPRSECRYLSEAQHDEAPTILAALAKNLPAMAGVIGKADPKRKSPAFDDKKMEGNPHHAIVPTEKTADTTGFSPIEKNVYDLIVRSYLAQFFPPAVFSATKIEAVAEGERFTASGKTPVSAGWREVYAPADEDDGKGDDQDEKEGKQTLPAMQKGDSAPCQKCDVNSKQTTPPPRFDESSLLDAMINLHKYVTDANAKARLKDGSGIGTSATRAGIIKDLRERGFLEPVKGSKTKFQSTKDARALIDALPGPVKDPTMAGIFKLALDAIAKGALPYETFIERNVGFITKVCGDLRQATMNLPLAPSFPCPKCQGGKLTMKKGSKGPFWSCSNWNSEPKCEAIFNDAGGKPQLAPPPEITCPKCKTGKLRRIKGSKGFFWSCSNYKAEPKCDASYDDRAGKPNFNPAPRKPAAKGGRK